MKTEQTGTRTKYSSYYGSIIDTTELTAVEAAPGAEDIPSSSSSTLISTPPSSTRTPESSSDDLIGDDDDEHAGFEEGDEIMGRGGRNILEQKYLSISRKNYCKEGTMSRSSLRKRYHGQKALEDCLWKSRAHPINHICMIFVFLVLMLMMMSSFLPRTWSFSHEWLSHRQEQNHDLNVEDEEEYDYIIVGAGPAGLLTAINLAKKLQQEVVIGDSLTMKGTVSPGKVLLLESGTKSQSDVMKKLYRGDSTSLYPKEEKQGEYYQSSLLPFCFVGKQTEMNQFDIPLLWSELSSKIDLKEYLSHHWPVDQTFLGRAVGGSGIHNAM